MKKLVLFLLVITPLLTLGGNFVLSGDKTILKHSYTTHYQQLLLGDTLYQPLGAANPDNLYIENALFGIYRRGFNLLGDTLYQPLGAMNPDNLYIENALYLLYLQTYFKTSGSGNITGTLTSPRAVFASDVHTILTPIDLTYNIYGTGTQNALVFGQNVYSSGTSHTNNYINMNPIPINPGSNVSDSAIGLSFNGKTQTTFYGSNLKTNMNFYYARRFNNDSIITYQWLVNYTANYITTSNILNGFGLNKSVSSGNITLSVDSTKIATKAYVNSTVNTINPTMNAQVATNAILPNSPIYNNAASGIGATITTATLNTSLVVDNYTPALNELVLVKNEGDASGLGSAKNGLFKVTQLATLGLPWILTRSLDYDQPSDINNSGDIGILNNGSANNLSTWRLITTVTNVGIDAITYTKILPNPSTIITGNGTTNRLPLFNGTTSLTNSSILQSVGTLRDSTLAMFKPDSIALPIRTTTTTGKITGQTFIYVANGDSVLCVYDGIKTDSITFGAWHSWIPVWAGFSANPTITYAKFYLSGHNCFIHIETTSGTSNATTATMTVPFKAKSSTATGILAFVTNNGTQTSGTVVFTGGSATVSLCAGGTNCTTFSATGTKNLLELTTFYEIIY